MFICDTGAAIRVSALKRRDRTRDSEGSNTEEPVRNSIDFGMDEEIQLIEEEACERHAAE